MLYLLFNRKKKKKDKGKDKELSKLYENMGSHASTSTEEGSLVRVDKRTKAELAFEKAKEKKVKEVFKF